MHAANQKRLAFNQSLHAVYQSWIASGQNRKMASHIVHADNENR